MIVQLLRHGAAVHLVIQDESEMEKEESPKTQA